MLTCGAQPPSAAPAAARAALKPRSIASPAQETRRPRACFQEALAGFWNARQCSPVQGPELGGWRRASRGPIAAAWLQGPGQGDWMAPGDLPLGSVGRPWRLGEGRPEESATTSTLPPPCPRPPPSRRRAAKGGPPCARAPPCPIPPPPSPLSPACTGPRPPRPPPCAAPPRLTQLAGGRHGPAAGCSAGARTVAAAKPLPS